MKTSRWPFRVLSSDGLKKAGLKRKRGRPPETWNRDMMKISWYKLDWSKAKVKKPHWNTWHEGKWIKKKWHDAKWITILQSLAHDKHTWQCLLRN
jgi:hypothetical protein